MALIYIVEHEASICIGEIEIDNIRHRCLVGGETVELTYKEHELLKNLTGTHITIEF